MRIILSLRDSYWRADVDGTDHQIVPEDRTCVAVVKAIKVKHPEAHVFVDHLSVANPHLRDHLFTCRHYNIEPQFHFFDEARQNNAVKKCTLCRNDAWYDAWDKIWKCASCFAWELDGTFFHPIRSRHVLPSSKQRKKQEAVANERTRRKPKPTPRPQTEQTSFWDGD